MQIDIPAEAKEDAVKSNQMLEFVKCQKVTSNEDYQSANEKLKDIKRLYKDLDEKRKSITRPIDAAKKSVMDFFKAPLFALSESERHLKATMLDWNREQERKRREEERKLQEAARKEEEKRRKALERKAVKAEQKGKEELAQELREEKETVYVAPPVMPEIRPSAHGSSIRKVWKAKVVSMEKLPKEFLIIDQKKLDGVARATKGTMSIEGVEFYTEDIMSIRS